MVDEEDIMLSINFDLSILTTQKGISLFGKIPFVFTLKLRHWRSFLLYSLVNQPSGISVKGAGKVIFLPISSKVSMRF